MKKLLILLMGLLLSGSALQAQTTIVTVGTGTSYSAYTIPGFYGSHRDAALYTANEIGVGGTISQIAYNIYSQTAGTGRSVKIYMMEVGDTVLTASLIPNWNAAKANATLVFDSTNVSFPVGWRTITLTTPFSYSGGRSLLVLVEGKACGSSGTCSVNNYYSSTNSINRHWYYRVDNWSVNDSTMAGTFNAIDRANIKFAIDSSSVTCQRPFAPIVSTVTPTDATLNWQARGSQTQWIISYKASSATTWTDQIINTPTFNFNNTLLPQTTYAVKVKADCGADTSYPSQILTFTTPCAYPTLPLYEGFESTGTSSPAVPDCWSYIRTYSSSSLYAGTSYAYSGTKGYYMYNNSSITANDKMMLVSPCLQEDISTLRVRFFAKYTSSYANKLRIGYMPNPADGSTFHEVDTITLTSDWRQYTVKFDTITGTGNYIAFDITAPSAANYVALDEIIIEQIPACPDVNQASIKVTNITTNTVDISCDILPETSNYDIRYRKQGVAVWSEDLDVTMPHQLSGLDPSSYYEVSIRSNCGSGSEGAWTYSSYFWTAFTIPLSQYFDSATIAGWYYARIGTTGVIYTTNYAGEYVSSPRAVYLSNGAYAPNDKLYLGSPIIDPSVAMGALQVRFKAKANTLGQKLSVGVMNIDSINSFTLVELVPLTTEWNTYIVNLSNYTGTDYNVAFGHNGNTSSTNIYMDNIDISYIPACQEVSDVIATNVTDQEIDLTWRDVQASGYTVEYEVNGSGNPQTQISTTNTTLLQGLTLGTTYVIRIKANCTPEIWSDTIKITTLSQIPAIIPFTEDFESDSPDWLLVNGTQTNKWYIDTAAKFSGNKGLYISDTNGVLNRYKNNSTSKVYAVKAIDFDAASDYLIKYDWRNKGESASYDYLKIVLIPSSTPLVTAGTDLNVLTGIDLYGGTSLWDQTTWQHKEVVFRVAQPGAYNLVMYWNNDGSGGANPPAAVDNIYVEKLTCMVPSGISVNNITTNTADVTFKAPANASYVRFVYTSSFGIDSVDYTISNYQTDTVFQLANLHQGTEYQMYAKADCSGDNSPVSATYSFQTALIAPWLETFDSTGSTFPPTIGWSRKSYLYTPTDTMRTANMTNVTSYWSQGTVDGNKTAYINIWTTSVKYWLMTPIINLDATHTWNLNFDVKLADAYGGTGAPTRANDDKFIVLISKDDGNTWAPADAIVWDTASGSAYPYSSLNENWQNINIPLTNISGNIKIAFYGESTVSNADDYLHVDNVSIVSCAKPSTPTVSNVVPTSANVSWIHPTATDFVVEYRVDTIGAAWSSNNVVGTNTTLILSPNTKYLVRVKTDCGGGDYSFYTHEVSFITPCSAAILPIFENFDNTAGSTSSPNAPTCWSYVRDYSSAGAYVSSSSPFSTPNCYYLYNSGASSTQKTALISPYFSNPINTMRARFMAKGGSGYKLLVGHTINSSNTTTFTIVDTVNLTSSWSQYIVAFDTVSANANCVVFLHGQTGTYQSIYLDDINIEPIPPCADVMGLAASAIDPYTGEIAWNTISSATGFDVQYKLSSATVWTNAPSTTNNIDTIRGLQPDSDYQVRVRTKCNAADSGVWSQQVTFTTPCVAFELPFFEDFSGTPFVSRCWNQYSGTLDTNGASTLSTGSNWGQKEFANITNAPKAAKMNIYGTRANWLVTPIIELGNVDAVLEFKLALVKWISGTADTITLPAEGVDDRFIVFASTDGIWNIHDTLAVWDNAGSWRVYDSISHAQNGELIRIPLTNLSGNVRIAFYGESVIANADNDLFVDSVTVKMYTPPCQHITSVTTVTDGTTATATWVAPEGQTQWGTRCDKVGGPIGVPVIVNTNPVHTFTGLERGSSYTVSVWAICSVGITSDTVVSSQFTISTCGTVSSVQATPCATTASITWEAPAGQTEWQWICTPESGGEPVADGIVTQTHDVIENLASETAYSLQIRSICGPKDTGDYVQLLFSTIACQSLDTIGITHETGEDSIFVSWNRVGCHKYWEISVVPLNADPDLNNVKVADVNTGIWVTVPDAYGQYTVYVRGICEGEYDGPWKDKEAKLSISPVGNKIPVKVVLAPNPARDYTKLSIEGVTGEVEVVLMTTDGKVLRKEKLNCQASGVKDIILQSLAKGTYLIHLTHKNWTKVERLVVQ